MGCNGSKGVPFPSDFDCCGPDGWPTVEASKRKAANTSQRGQGSVSLRAVSGPRQRDSGDRSRSRSRSRRNSISEAVIERPAEECKVHGAETALCTLLEDVRPQQSFGEVVPAARPASPKGRQWGYSGVLRPLPELQFVRIPDGEDIAVRSFNSSGFSHTLVLLHGRVGNHLLWREVVEHPALAGVRLVTVDLRGSGFSSYRQRITSHAELAADVAYVIKALQLEGCTLVGHASGAATATEVAANEPGLLASLCLVSAIPPCGTSSCYPLSSASGSVVSSLSDWETQTQAGSHSMSVDTWKNMFVDASMAMLPSGSERWEELTQSFAQQRNSADIAWADYSFNITSEANPCSPGSNKWANVTCPVFIIHGEHDKIAHAAIVSRLMKSSPGEGARITVLPYLQTGHLPMLECLDTFVRKLVQCLPSIDASQVSLHSVHQGGVGNTTDRIPVAVV